MNPSPSIALPEITFNSNIFSIGFELVFYVLVIAFVIQAWFLSYHWFTYGSERRISMIALCTYLSGGAILFLTYASALNTF